MASHLNHFGILLWNYTMGVITTQQVVLMIMWLNECETTKCFLSIKDRTLPKAKFKAGLNAWEVKGDRHQKRARSPHEPIPGGALKPLPGFRPRPRWSWGLRGRAHGEECVAAAGAAEAFPAAHYLEFQGPREIRPRERLKATARAKAPGRTRARAGGAGSAAPLVPELLIGEAGAEPGKAAHRGLRPAGLAASSASHPPGVSFLPSTLPAPRLRGVVHGRGRGKPASPSLTWDPGSGARKRSSDREGPGGRLQSAS